MSSGEDTKQNDSSTSELDIILPDETVMLDTRPSWAAWTAWFLLAGFVALVGLVAMLLAEESRLLMLALVVDLLIVGAVWYQRRRIRYVVTDKRMIVLTGVTSKSTNEAWLEDIRGMQTGASFFERLAGLGTITVSESILPRRTGLPLVSAFAGIVPLPGRGLTLSGIGDYQRVANMIRKYQSVRKG